MFTPPHPQPGRRGPPHAPQAPNGSFAPPPPRFGRSDFLCLNPWWWGAKKGTVPYCLPLPPDQAAGPPPRAPGAQRQFRAPAAPIWEVRLFVLLGRFLFSTPYPPDRAAGAPSRALRTQRPFQRPRWPCRRCCQKRKYQVLAFGGLRAARLCFADSSSATRLHTKLPLHAHSDVQYGIRNGIHGTRSSTRSTRSSTRNGPGLTRAGGR